MLDKTIPYKKIIMRKDDVDSEIPAPILPPGFSFRFFTPSDTAHWARIETSVLEFDSTDLAADYFEKSFLPRSDEIHKRLIFAVNPAGLPIATATAFFENGEYGHQTCLHWVAVCPEEQGKGIGKAITLRALSVQRELEPGSPVWLQTQTWSHKAVRLYHSLGFNMVKSDFFAKKENEYAEAMEVLKAVMDEEYLNILRSSAV